MLYVNLKNMEAIDVEAFKKAGFTYEGIQDIIEWEQEFEQSGELFDFEEVKKFARNELFSEQEGYAKS